MHLNCIAKKKNKHNLNGVNRNLTATVGFCTF